MNSIPIFLLSIGILGFIIFKSAYRNNKLTCKKYVLNTYLYIILSLLIVSVTVLVMDKYDLDKYISFQSGMVFFIFLFLTIGMLLLTMFLSPQQTILKHISWLIFITLIGITLFPIYKLGKMTSVLSSTLFTTLSIVIILTAIAFYKPEWISLSWQPILLVLLIAGILLKIGLMVFTKDTGTYNKWSIILSYGFVILFSLLLLYDTKKLQVNAMNCKIPNYINESIGIFLDILNLFSNLTRIKAGN